VLVPHEVPLLQAARRMQKAALISNFVDRESERPALGPNDFVPLAITGPVSDPEKMDQSRKLKRKLRYAVQNNKYCHLVFCFFSAPCI
jgi:myb proto-oncogene protein